MDCIEFIDKFRDYKKDTLPPEQFPEQCEFIEWVLPRIQNGLFTNFRSVPGVHHENLLQKLTTRQQRHPKEKIHLTSPAFVNEQIRA